ncbi:MAG: HAD family hydrolase [Chloroflexi bacterium]|nr:HAD family hydrolase [Chloroflexota bacterium]
MRCKAVLFDLYGTLAGFDPPREQIQTISAKLHGLELDPLGILKGYGEADDFMAAQNAVAPMRKMNVEELAAFFSAYEQIILRHAGHEVDLETAGEIWTTIRKQEYGLTPFADTVPELNRLRDAGRTVGVVSNMADSGQRVADQVGLTDHVDFLITSRDAGANKPHPPIFLHALEQANCAAEEAVLIGDSIDSDIDGAFAVGIKPILIDRDNRHRDYKSHPRITSLGELEVLLKALESS